MSADTAAFARRWPAGRGSLTVMHPDDWARADSGTVAVVAPELGWDDVFAGLSDALARGAWVALPVERCAALGARWGVPAAAGRFLLLRAAGAAAPEWAFRARDAALALIAIVTLAPLFAVLAGLVFLDSGRPVFYRTQVVGRVGRLFTWRKFRSMRPGPTPDAARADAFRRFAAGEAPAAGGTKVIDVDRVTGVGRLLRRHSLDELPQIVNVARGDMAIVGPRPCLPYEFDVMRPWQRARTEVRPGLTGLWQIYGRSRVGFDESMVMDRLYAMTRSWWRDWGLMARTVTVVVAGRGGR